MKTTFAVLTIAAAWLAACGGAQTPAPTTAPAAPRESCVDTLWETPPSDVGQTPPAVVAPDDVLAPFEGEGSGP
jgi:hypothetical protein